MTVFGIIWLSVLTHLPSGIDPFRAVGLHLGGGQPRSAASSSTC